MTGSTEFSHDTGTADLLVHLRSSYATGAPVANVGEVP